MVSDRGLCALVMLVGLAGSLAGCGSEDVRSEAATLAASSGLEARLASTSVATLDSPPTSPELHSLRHRVLSASLDSDHPDALLGLLALSERRWDEAIERLASAAGLSSSWQDYNDLAVARLARFQGGGDATDIVAALASLRAAAAMAPDREEVAFNQRLAWAALGVVVGGQPTAKGPPSWDAPSWETLRDQLQHFPTVGSEQLRVAVTSYPLAVHEFVRVDLVERWSQARQEGDHFEAERWLDLGSALGDHLSRRMDGSDIQALCSYLREGCESPRCVQAHARYAAGARAFREGFHARAEAALEASSGRLRSLGSPLAPWARYYWLYTTFHRDVEASAVALRELLDEVEAADPFLAGRVHWRLAVAEGSSHRSAEAFRHLHEGARRMCGSADAPQCGFRHVLEAELHDIEGDVRTAWNHRARGLRAVLRHGTARQVHSALTEASLALVRQGFSGVAAPLVDEMARRAEMARNPELLSEAQRTMGRQAASEGRLADARRHFALARRWAVDVQDGPRRHHLTCTTDLAEGTALVEDRPRLALVYLARAENELSCWSNVHYRLMIHVSQASALRRVGDRAGAELEMTRALAIFEERREEMDGFPLWALISAQPVYDAMTALLFEEGRVEEALSVNERSRGRFLVEARQRAGETSSGILSAVEIMSALPSDTLLVEYSVLEDRVLAWVVGGGRIRGESLPLGRDRVRELVTALRARLASGADDADLRPLTTELHELLVTPLGLDLDSYSRLLVVPDRALLRLPFAGLVDPARGRLLIERVAVVTSPSASMVLGAAGEREAWAPPLIVAGPDLTGTPDDSLPRLPGTGYEAARVLRHFPDAVLLRRERATRRAMLDRADGAAFVHFAGHALADPTAPFRSRLPLARDPGRAAALEMSDLLQRRLVTPLVVLSACRSISGFRADREATLGLAGGFYVAGASAVVATLWDARDEANEELFDAFYRHFAAGERPSVALQRAVLDVRRRGVEGGKSLYDWGNFIVLEELST